MKKKVALLGDSIRINGYGTKVPNMLGDGYEVFQPLDNCRWAQYTFRMLYDYKEDLKDCDVIHWNNGLWDCAEPFDDGTFTSIDDYVKAMVRVAKLLLEITPNVIFATTTPTKPTHRHIRSNQIDKFNQAIVPVLKSMGIKINDLNSLLKNNEDIYICEDEVHLSEEGIMICADAVCKAIKQFD
ncbi:MAG: SGNH/GDSL hydrolase family protein [Clostridia bacterium]|nr:SGNH/GDSL hydrolase family protein [Clostridia bacterium]